MKDEKTKNPLYLLGIILCAAIFVLPVWLYGVPRSNDLNQHYQFAASIEDSLRNGSLYPNWAAQENEGYGGIGLRFYPPVAYYVLAFGKILTNDWFTASLLAFLFWTMLAGFGTFLLAREFSSAKASFVGAVMYIFAPYHATELYGSFMYAEFAAAAVLPFCFLFLTRILHKNNPSDIFGFALAFAILIYTHLPLSVIACLSFAVYVLFSIKKETIFPIAKSLSLAFLLGILASSFQWVKVVSEMKWLKHATEKFSATDFYDYRENFLLSFKYLAGLDADIHHLWFFDLLFAVTLVFAVPFAVIAFRYADAEKKKRLKSVAALAIFTVFILTPLSLFVWNNVSILQKVQFPWRWLSVFSICAVIFVSAGFDFAREFAKTKKRPLFLILCGCLFVGIAFSINQVIRQALFIPANEFTNLTEKIISRPNNEEWLTIWANKETSKTKENVQINRNCDILEWKPTAKSFRVADGNEDFARISQFYYPFWYAKINGAVAETKPADDGALLVKIPQNEANVSLEFIEPPSTKISFIISLLTFILSFFLYFWTKSKFTKSL